MAAREALGRTLAREREEAEVGRATLRSMLEEAEARAGQAEARAEEGRRAAAEEAEAAAGAGAGLLAEAETGLARQRRRAEEAEGRAAGAEEALAERDGEVRQLRAEVGGLRAELSEHEKDNAEADRELDELQDENEDLERRFRALEEERDALRREVRSLEGGQGKVAGLQMELQMLREERDRDRARLEAAAEDATSAGTALASDRDAARAEAADADQRLAAALADLGVARSDLDRMVAANDNLQAAMASFEAERDAEADIVEEQRRIADEAMQAAHEASLQATVQANEGRMREVQEAADQAVRNVMGQIDELERTVQECRKENVGLRRSLDEAIQRLQTNEEDVIDRSLIKNILLDWIDRGGKSRKQVLELMASVLHFTDEEKARVGVYVSGDGIHGVGPLGKVVDVVAAPLPHNLDNVELDGDSVREKWVNFLLAETGGAGSPVNASDGNPNGETPQPKRFSTGDLESL